MTTRTIADFHDCDQLWRVIGWAIRNVPFPTGV